MSRQLVTIIVSTCIIMIVVCTAVSSARAQAERESPDIFRIEISQCTYAPEEIRFMTGFRVAGISGIVTALHGVADGCKKINAVGGSDDGQVFNNLTLAKVDVDADVVLLSSNELQTSTRTSRLKATTKELQPSTALRIVGYPFGIVEQLSSESLRVRSSALVPLRRLIPPNVASSMLARNSPSPSISVISVEGHFLPGQSGAPVFNTQGEIVGVVNGGLQGGNAEVSWMIQWNDIFLEPVDQPAVKGRLQQLQSRPPDVVFAWHDEASSPEPTATAVVYEYGVVVHDSSTGNLLEQVKVTLYIGGKITATCYSDSDGYCALRYVSSNQPARLRVQKIGYQSREREISDLLHQVSAQMIDLDPASVPAPPTVTEVPPPPATTSTPVVQPTTSVPPTNTITRCPIKGVLADPWREHQDQLGCNVDDAFFTDLTYQVYQNGTMVWLKATDTIYVLARGEPWTRHKSVWDPSQPIFSCPDAETMQNPSMGFGKLWCDIPKVRANLGNPTSAEIPMKSMYMQYFEGGLVYEMNDGKAYVLLDDGSWTQH